MSWNESAAAQTHPLITVPTHDGQAQQLFVRDIKLYVMQFLEPAQRSIADHILTDSDTRFSNDPVGDLREAMAPLKVSGAGSASSARPSANFGQQSATASSKADRLEQLADIETPRESAMLNPAFDTPPYIAHGEILLISGGNGYDDRSVLQGAVMDRGDAVYMLGRDGGMLTICAGR